MPLGDLPVTMILILGASSFIGRHLFRAYGPARAIGTYCGRPVADGRFFDATRMRLADVVPRDAAVSHAVLCFAEPKIDACKADRQRSDALNVRAAIAAIDELLDRGITPVFLSTEYVFDGRRGGYTEEDPPNPTTVYGGQKLEVERHLARRTADFVVLRLAKVFSVDPEEETILSGWCRQLRDGETIDAATDQVFSPIEVRDVVAAVEAVIRRNLRGVFHLATPEAWSRLGMLRLLMERLGMEGRVIPCRLEDLRFLDHRPRDLSLDPAKLLGATGLTFRDVRSGCEEFAQRAHALSR